MELNVMVNGIADSVSSNKGIATILDNPIYTALLMTLVVILIFYFSGAYGRKSARMSRRLRVAFYIFCSLLAVIFVYHRRFQKIHSEQNRRSEIQSALASPPTMLPTERVAIIQPVYMDQQNLSTPQR